MQERVRKFDTRFMSDEDSDDEEFYENQGPSIQRLINYLDAEVSSQPLKITKTCSSVMTLKTGTSISKKISVPILSSSKRNRAANEGII
jgi:hypothetical protein